MSYNGWTNWETWQTSHYFHDELTMLAQESDTKESFRNQAENMLYEDLHDPGGGMDQLIIDIINAFIGEVDFYDLANTYCEDDEE